MFLKQISDPSLAQNAYLIGCQCTGEAIIVDPERDIDRYLKIAADNGLKITSVADTHIHADYLSGTREFMKSRQVTAYLSAEGGADWQFEWARINPNVMFLYDGCKFKIGKIELTAVLTAGHTPEHMSFLITDLGGGATQPMALLSGDFLFVGDVGRPDLLESAAGLKEMMVPRVRSLFKSLRATSKFSEHLQILPTHGAGNAYSKVLGAVPTSVLGYERLNNGALREALEGSEENFINNILSWQPEPPRYFARIKRDNKFGPALLPNGKLPQPRRLFAAELPTLIDEETHTILDLRLDRVAFMKQHLKGSLYAPMNDGKLPIVAGSYLDKDASIILLVPNESDLDEAIRQLVRIGLDKVHGWIPANQALTLPGITTTQPSITTALLADALTAHPGAMVLDVRSAEEFDDAHVKGAKNIVYTHLATRFAEVPTNNPLFVHCRSGDYGSFAVPFLASHDREVIYVDGAFDEIPESLKKNKTTTRIYQRQTA